MNRTPITDAYTLIHSEAHPVLPEMALPKVAFVAGRVAGDHAVNVIQVTAAGRDEFVVVYEPAKLRGLWTADQVYEAAQLATLHEIDSAFVEVPLGEVLDVAALAATAR